MLMSSSARWLTSFFKSIDTGTHLISLPSLWFSKHAILWPPDGILSATVMLVLVLVVHTYLFVYGVTSVCYQRLRRVSMDSICTRALTLCHQLHSSHSKLIHSSRYDLNIHALATSYALSLDEIEASHKLISWDTDSVPAVVDNSANTHIWTRLDDFIPGSLRYFEDDDDVGVITIGNESSRPVGIGRVPLQWKDNQGNDHDVILEEALYFPASPVNIISVSYMAKQYDDPDGTWIKSRWHRSTFSWNCGQFAIDFDHPSSNLPILQVNIGSTQLSSFVTLCRAASATIDAPALTTCRTYLPSDRFNNICFVTDNVESAQGDPRYRFTPKETLENIFLVGDKLRLTRNGVNEVVEVVDFDIAEDSLAPIFSVVLNDGTIIQVAKEFLSQLDDDDLALIPITQDQVQEHIQRLDSETLEALLNPPRQSDLVQEFMAWHNRSGHLPFTTMFKLCENGYFPKRFLQLKRDGVKLICPSCVFGKCRRRSWRTRGQPGSIRSDLETKPGDRVSIDHIISAQPGQVPRMDGRHTRDRITAGCVFFDHVSGHSYTHLQTSVDNTQTVAAKHGYEQFAESHGVSVRAFHADNGIFAEKAFRDEVSSSNQRITYCAVGAHHQNGIIERHIQTLTHGARTNLLHAQRRWPEARGSILWPFAWKDFER